MTPFASVAMLEKLALLKIALCSAPVFSRSLRVADVDVYISRFSRAFVRSRHVSPGLTRVAGGLKNDYGANGVRLRGEKRPIPLR